MGTLDHASRAPQLMLCNHMYSVCVTINFMCEYVYVCMHITGSVMHTSMVCEGVEIGYLISKTYTLTSICVLNVARFVQIHPDTECF